MATAPKPLQLRKEDYKEAQLPWLARLFQQLNDFFSSVTIALARGLTRSENLRSTVKTVTFTTRSPVENTWPISVKHDLGQRPTDVWVGSIRTQNATAISNPWSMTWELDTAGNLSVRFQGLTASTPYECRLILE